MTRMRAATIVCCLLGGFAALSACRQVGPAVRAGSASAGLGRSQDPAPESGRAARRQRAPTGDEGRPYGQTRARLQFFREDIELDELDLQRDVGPDLVLRDTERTRQGFRADFGNRAAGGFFQLFAEEFRAPLLSVGELDNYGIGGGVVGAPVVGGSGRVEFVVPYRFEVDLVVGGESGGSPDEDIGYLEAMFDLGFGARVFGLQASSGLQLRSIGGRFDSDDPAAPAGTAQSDFDGTNVGAYVELLYKHDRVPLMARVRGLAGDIRGLELSFGFAF